MTLNVPQLIYNYLQDDWTVSFNGKIYDLVERKEEIPHFRIDYVSKVERSRKRK